ncbi:MAG: M23 family metallopeptidase [Microlunatus sp.]
MQSPRALARRSAPTGRRRPEYGRLTPGIIHAGLATLAVSVLSLGVAAGVPSSSSAQTTDAGQPAVAVTVVPGVEQPSEFERDSNTISRSNFREALTDTSKAVDFDLTALSEAAESPQVDLRANDARTALLADESEATAKRQRQIEKAKKKAAAAEKKALGTPTLPVRSYTIVARFGDVGAWARYHTGLDFSAPIGTAIHAPTAGVVEHAGSGGEAGGWAGTYVVLKHADGTQSLYAHMSSISVQQGDRVTGGELLGHVGQSGRAFGPHLHFEIYPAGTTPGDVYTAVDPMPWLKKLGLKP